MITVQRASEANLAKYRDHIRSQNIQSPIFVLQRPGNKGPQFVDTKFLDDARGKELGVTAHRTPHTKGKYPYAHIKGLFDASDNVTLTNVTVDAETAPEVFKPGGIFAPLLDFFASLAKEKGGKRLYAKPGVQVKIPEDKITGYGFTSTEGEEASKSAFVRPLYA